MKGQYAGVNAVAMHEQLIGFGLKWVVDDEERGMFEHNITSG